MRPVFIGGAVRSGTTLLADMLGCHPQVSPIYETEFLVNLLDVLFCEADYPSRIRSTMRRFVDRMPTLGQKKPAHERFVHGRYHVLLEPGAVLDETERFIEECSRDAISAYRGFIERLFSRHALADDKPGWVNKTPAALHYAPALHHAFPDLLLVHVYRDGRAVAASSLPLDFGPSSIREAARWWSTTMQYADDFAAQHPDHILEVRYEHLLEDPAAVLARVLGAMELTLPPSLLTTWSAATGGVAPERAVRWKQSMDGEALALFEGVAGRSLDHRGYARACSTE